MAVMHYVRYPGHGFHRTYCGIECSPCRHVSEEFDTIAGRRIDGKSDGWKGVTCKRCLAAHPAGSQLERIR